METYKTLTKGLEISRANKAIIMLHGRGGRAEDILAISGSFNLGEYSMFAPQAPGNVWYPHSFLSPLEENEPFLSASLEFLRLLIQDIVLNGIPSNQIFFMGFSQGACLASEFIARNAKRYGGAAIFTGGLIGDKIFSDNYQGNLEGTPIFLGAGDPDAHVPLTRIKQTNKILNELGGVVTEKIYANIGHTIISDEIRMANEIIFK